MKSGTKKFSLGLIAFLALILGPLNATAATIVVTPSNQQGWSTADTRPGGSVEFAADATAPAGTGALRLKTDSTNAAKAQFMHQTSTPLSGVTELSYYSNRQSASFVDGNASYQLVVLIDGTEGSFTTFVYEPYENGGTGVADGTWHSWDVDSGQFWSSRTVTTDDCSVTAGAGGPPYYTLAGLQASCPNAVVIGFGVNVGSYNPSYNILVDLVSFNGTAYDFERTYVPLTKDDCKNGGWELRTNGDGGAFRNQGDCIQFVNTGK